MSMQKSHTESSSSPLRITRRRVSRIIPFGYEVSEENDKLLVEVPEEMELLSKARIETMFLRSSSRKDS